MDLRNNQITVAQLLSNPGARAILNREFPGLINSPMIGFARGYTLARVLQMAAGQVDPRKVNKIIAELEAL